MSGEIIIDSQNFENSMNMLNEISINENDELELKMVQTKNSVVRFLNHKVTGEEFNERLVLQQQFMIEVYSKLIDIDKNFDWVYRGMCALNKDYLERILSIMSETNKNVEKLDKLSKVQEETLELLVKFKQKLDNYSHLKDIDEIWSDCQNWYKEIKELSSLVDDVSGTSEQHTKDIDELFNELSIQIKKLESVMKFTSKLENCIHLLDVDDMWNTLSDIHKSVEDVSNDFQSAKNILSKQQSDIEMLQSYMETLSRYEHLNDIDEIWNKNEEHHSHLNDLMKKSDEIKMEVSSNAKHIEAFNEYKEKLSQIKHLEQVDTMWETKKVQADKLEEVAKQTEDVIRENHETQKKLKNFIEYKEYLSRIIHLNDVDEMWCSTNEQTGQLSELEKQVEELNVLIQNNKKSNEDLIIEVNEKNDTAVQVLTKKIKYAYLLAGGTLGVALIELVIIFSKGI